jgi:hypothetical protein
VVKNYRFRRFVFQSAVSALLLKACHKKTRNSGEMTGWISGSASTNVAGFGGCATAYPPTFSAFNLGLRDLSRVGLVRRSRIHTL